MQFDITEEVACIYGKCSLFFEMTKNRCVFNVHILDCKVFKLKYYCIISYWINIINQAVNTNIMVYIYYMYSLSRILDAVKTWSNLKLSPLWTLQCWRHFQYNRYSNNILYFMWVFLNQFCYFNIKIPGHQDQTHVFCFIIKCNPKAFECECMGIPLLIFQSMM